MDDSSSLKPANGKRDAMKSDDEDISKAFRGDNVIVCGLPGVDYGKVYEAMKCRESANIAAGVYWHAM